MFGGPSTQSPATPSADDLESGERVLAALDDVRYVPRTIPGHIGRLAITDRHLRFRETRGAMSEVLHGFPSLGELRGGGVQLALPRSEVVAVSTSRRLGLFSELHATLRDGRVLTFHVGLRGLGGVVAALGIRPSG